MVSLRAPSNATPKVDHRTFARLLEVAQLAGTEGARVFAMRACSRLPWIDAIFGASNAIA